MTWPPEFVQRIWSLTLLHTFKLHRRNSSWDLTMKSSSDASRLGVGAQEAQTTDCQQLVSKRTARLTTRQQGSGRNIAFELVLCCGTRGSVLSRAGGPIRSHGRGHRFDTCRAHQRKHLPPARSRRRLPEDLPEGHGQRYCPICSTILPRVCRPAARPSTSRT